MKPLALVIVSLFFLMSCGSKDGRNRQMNIEDLPYHTAADAKAYADLILKTVRTNRDKPLSREFEDGTPINLVQMNRIVGMYSTGIGGRKDWDYFDVYEKEAKKDQSKGFDYVWLDPRGRLGIQIYILPILVDGRFRIKNIEFRSRIDVMESVAFPGGDIEDYKKLDMKW